MASTGRNGLKSIDVIFNPFMGPEIKDVNLDPFESVIDYFNPYKLISAGVTRLQNVQNGVVFGDPLKSAKNSKTMYPDAGASVKYHSLDLNRLNVGQQLDIDSHYEKVYKYNCYNEFKPSNLILYGVSRGTSATFCAMAQYNYANVKLVILEGAIDSLDSVISGRVENYIRQPIFYIIK